MAENQASRVDLVMTGPCFGEDEVGANADKLGERTYEKEVKNTQERAINEKPERGHGGQREGNEITEITKIVPGLGMRVVRGGGEVAGRDEGQISRKVGVRYIVGVTRDMGEQPR